MFSGFDQIFQDTQTPFCVLDPDLRCIAANQALCDLLGLSMATVLYEPIRNYLPTNADTFAQPCKSAPTRLHNRGDGNSPDHWWDLTCTPLEAGNTLCQITDVSNTVRRLRQHDIAVGELQHRVGNVLNVVQALARRMGHTARDHETFLDALDDRITALGVVYTNLSGENWYGMDLRCLIKQQLPTRLRDNPTALAMTGPDWQLSVIHAQAFAIGIHELLLNARAFGALRGGAGQVQISWENRADGSQSFTWSEAGQTDVQAPQRQGFGTEMLLSFLPIQLGGVARQDFTPEGMRYHLTVPAGVAVPLGQGGVQITV
ncbi:HWE histidine kinase domain-containing protein [Yoonia sp. BS5-3]|uniref:histidine kinase n=1 Tax=Yoonia phaeophyticola TaxID=3137369 RepID=A0ABZ2V2B7_9RHOB